jgi:hypothetical protein
MLLVDSIFLAIMVVLLPKHPVAMPGFEVVSCTKPRAFICSSFSHALDASADSVPHHGRSPRGNHFQGHPWPGPTRRFLGWTWRHLKFEPMEIYKMLDLLYIIIDDYICKCIYIYILDIFRTWITLNLMVHLGFPNQIHPTGSKVGTSSHFWPYPWSFKNVGTKWPSAAQRVAWRWDFRLRSPITTG